MYHYCIFRQDRLIQVNESVEQCPKQGWLQRSRKIGEPSLFRVGLQVEIHFPCPNSQTDKNMQAQEAHCEKQKIDLLV